MNEDKIKKIEEQIAGLQSELDDLKFQERKVQYESFVGNFCMNDSGHVYYVTGFKGYSLRGVYIAWTYSSGLSFSSGEIGDFRGLRVINLENAAVKLDSSVADFKNVLLVCKKFGELLK